MKKLSLQEVVEGIEDTRRERSVWYPLYEGLLVMLAAVICGATSYVKAGIFGKSVVSIKRSEADYRRGGDRWETGVEEQRRKQEAPSCSKRVFCGMRTRVGELACEEKSNEIPAIPKLLELLEIGGCIVTIDAMGTETEIAQKITEKKADYILALKENQKTLYRDVALYFEEYRKEPAGFPAACHAVSHSQSHGQHERRTCYTCGDIGWLEGLGKWSHLHGIGVIFYETGENGKTLRQAHYFIYSASACCS